MMSSSFWAMGGYARFVWPCFGFAFVVLGWNLWAARRFQLGAHLRARRALAAAMTRGDET